MDLGDWDDDDHDFQKTENSPDDNMGDIIQFTDSLTLQSEKESLLSDQSSSSLSPLPNGVLDLTRNRGVLLQRLVDNTDGLKPSIERPFVEFHYEGFLLGTQERFESTRDQGYASIIRLDLPRRGQSTLIPGLELGLAELRAGEKAILKITSEFAYGQDGTEDIPGGSDLEFIVEILDVRASHRRVQTVDTSEKDLSRLETVRQQREMAQQRREEEAVAKDAEKQRKADRVAALREKLANKQKAGKKGGKKKS